MPEADLMRKGRTNNLSLAKELICYWGTHLLDARTIDLS